MSLPITQVGGGQALQSLLSQWKSQLDPVANNVIVSGAILTNVKLVNGTNTFNHLLSRIQQGYSVVDQPGAGTFYRSQPFNATTLTLTASGITGTLTISLLVF